MEHCNDLIWEVELATVLAFSTIEKEGMIAKVVLLYHFG